MPPGCGSGWFWIALWRRLREPAVGAGAGLVALVAVTLAMGFTGALLTFAPRILYPAYALRASQIGLDPLADQQAAPAIALQPAREAGASYGGGPVGGGGDGDAQSSCLPTISALRGSR